MKRGLVFAAIALLAPVIACRKDISGAWKFEAAEVGSHGNLAV